MSRADKVELAEREGGRLFGVAYRLLGTVADAEDQVGAVAAIAVAEGRITAIDLVVNPDKLEGVRRAAASPSR